VEYSKQFDFCVHDLIFEPTHFCVLILDLIQVDHEANEYQYLKNVLLYKANVYHDVKCGDKQDHDEHVHVDSLEYVFDE